MSIDRARLIVHNPSAYTPNVVREAAVWLIASLGASAEDLEFAATALKHVRGRV